MRPSGKASRRTSAAGQPSLSTARAPGVRAVFLDRDGVLNRCEVRHAKPYAPRRLADFRLLPRAADAVKRLKRAGFVVIVVTNQPDIGNGLVDPATVEAMHVRLRRAAEIDDIIMCPHSQNARCECRKPKPGMLFNAARRWHIDLSRSFLVGDRAGDIVAGQAAGCYSIFVDRGYGERAPEQPDGCAKSLHSAVEHILSRLNPEPRSLLHAISR